MPTITEALPTMEYGPSPEAPGPALDWLKRAPLGHFIGGKFTRPASLFEVINPATGAVLAQVSQGGARDVDRAVSAARKAAKGRKPAFDPELLDICEITIDDIAPIYHLGERVFTAERWPTLYRTWDEYEVVQAYLTDADTSLVAFYDDELVGFALGTMIEKPRNPWIYGYLKWLAVSPDHGQLGIGAALVKELRATFIENGARMLLVDTDADNELALRFFRRIGFGQETQHVYLSLNLTHERDYKRVRARKRRSGD